MKGILHHSISSSGLLQPREPPSETTTARTDCLLSLYKKIRAFSDEQVITSLASSKYVRMTLCSSRAMNFHRFHSLLARRFSGDCAHAQVVRDLFFKTLICLYNLTDGLVGRAEFCSSRCRGCSSASGVETGHSFREQPLHLTPCLLECFRFDIDVCNSDSLNSDHERGYGVKIFPGSI